MLTATHAWWDGGSALNTPLAPGSSHTLVVLVENQPDGQDAPPHEAVLQAQVQGSGQGSNVAEATASLGSLASADVSLPLTAPSTPGSYSVVVNLYQDGTRLSGYPMIVGYVTVPAPAAVGGSASGSTGTGIGTNGATGGTNSGGTNTGGTNTGGGSGPGSGTGTTGGVGTGGGPAHAVCPAGQAWNEKTGKCEPSTWLSREMADPINPLTIGIGIGLLLLGFVLLGFVLFKGE